jgi:hypothetical protein
MKDSYYPYFERLMTMTGQWPIAETYAYKRLCARYPHIAQSIRLEKERARLVEELRYSTDDATRHRLRAEISILNTKLRRESLLKRFHRESGQEMKYRVRFAVARAGTGVRIQERIQSMLPPTLQDIRSLDQTDRALALRQWIKKK